MFVPSGEEKIRKTAATAVALNSRPFFSLPLSPVFFCLSSCLARLYMRYIPDPAHPPQSSSFPDSLLSIYIYSNLPYPTLSFSCVPPVRPPQHTDPGSTADIGGFRDLHKVQLRIDGKRASITRLTLSVVE